MPFGKITPRPGINVEYSPTLNNQGWSGSNLMRWRLGLPEKLGGWSPLSPTPVVGTGSGMHTWADLNGNPYCMVGTEQRLQVYTQGVQYDITPQRATTNNAPAFSTTLDSTTVTITDNSNGTEVGDWIYLEVSVSVGGLVLQGFYQVINVVDDNDYQITAASAATAAVSSGGAVPEFTTTDTSATVEVTLANHGLSSTSIFFIEIATTVGGITLGVGAYPVTSIVDANDFNITAAAPATSNDAGFENAGNASIIYLISSGFAVNTLLFGYGIGEYGAGLYGIGSIPAGSSELAYLRQWTGDSWGASLVCNYVGGPIYEWTPPPVTVFPQNELTPPAQILGNAPSEVNTIFVHTMSEILVACGCNFGGGAFDPLLVGWCDQDDLTDWTPTSANQAGSYRLKSGSRIVGALMAPSQTGLIWTDTSLWAMQYIGYPDVFGFTQVGTNCGLIAMRAVGVLNSSVYWMGRNNFYVASPGGIPVPLQCTVWDTIFKNLNTGQLEQIFCAVNSLFNEVTWYYPSASGTGTIDSYVKYNTLEQTWDYGSLVRTCWDEGLVFGYPMGTDATGLVQMHETSNDANGQPLLYSFTTGYVDVGDGEQVYHVDQIWPDFVETANANVQVTLNCIDYPGQPVPRQYGPYSCIAGTKQFISPNARGRQMSLTFSGSDLGSFVRLGGTRYRYGTAGKKVVS